MTKSILLGVCALALSAATASALVVQLTPTGTDVLHTYYINKNGTGGAQPNANSPASNLYRLETYFLVDLCDDVIHLKPATQTWDWSNGGLAGFDYAVIHYGAGAYGGAGGTIAVYALNGADSFQFPKKGFSSIDLFGCPPDERVPDSGATIALLGAGLVALGIQRRFARA